MGKSAIFFADGLEEIEGLTVVDLFRRVALPIDIISISGSREITGAHGIRLGADLCFEEAAQMAAIHRPAASALCSQAARPA